VTNLARLTALAQDLIVRVRDDDPEANARWLAMETTAEERTALLFVLAAAVPDDRPWTELVAWTEAPTPRYLRPHGTAAALRRHQYHGEKACAACKAYDVLRKRQQRERGRAA